MRGEYDANRLMQSSRTTGRDSIEHNTARKGILIVSLIIGCILAVVAYTRFA